MILKSVPKRIFWKTCFTSDLSEPQSTLIQLCWTALEVCQLGQQLQQHRIPSLEAEATSTSTTVADTLLVFLNSPISACFDCCCSVIKSFLTLQTLCTNKVHSRLGSLTISWSLVNHVHMRCCYSTISSCHPIHPFVFSLFPASGLFHLSALLNQVTKVLCFSNSPSNDYSGLISRTTPSDLCN